MMTETIREQALRAIDALLGAQRAGLNPVKLLVIGCSSSEIAGGVIGHASAYELGEAVAQAAIDEGVPAENVSILDQTGNWRTPESTRI